MLGLCIMYKHNTIFIRLIDVHLCVISALLFYNYILYICNKILTLHIALSYYTNKLKNNMKMIPDTEMIVSNSDQVKNVSFTVKPKYSLNIQKPASFT